MKKTVVFAMLLSALCFCGCDYLAKINPFTKAEYSRQINSSVNNLKQIGNALEMYTQCEKDYLRPHGVTANGDLSKDPGLVFELLRVQVHLINAKVYAAPYGKTEVAEPNASLEGKNCGYVYIYVEPKYAAASAVAEAPSKIYIKLERFDESKLAPVYRMSNLNPGRCAVIIFDASVKKYLSVKNVYISADEKVITRLKSLYGELNVVVK